MRKIVNFDPNIFVITNISNSERTEKYKQNIKLLSLNFIKRKIQFRIMLVTYPCLAN